MLRERMLLEAAAVLCSSLDSGMACSRSLTSRVLETGELLPRT